MKLTNRACMWYVVLGLFAWYGGLSGAVGADVVTTDVATASDAATLSQPQVCVVQVVASGEVVSGFVNNPTDPTLAVLVPPATATNVPVSCQELTSIGLGVANQEASPVSVQIGVFTHQGTALCTRGPFTLSEHGARGVVFGSDCVEAKPSLRPFRNVIITGDYVAAGTGLRDRTGGNINISGIPESARVIAAILYTGYLDNGESPSLKNLNFNGAPITGTLIGSGPDTCWGRTNSFAYRADVTPFVSGNGIYSLTGVASGGAILAQGASLVVLYKTPGDPLKNVILMDGNVVFRESGAAATSTISGFLATTPVAAKTTFMVGDGQTFPETASFTGGAGTTTFANPFNGSDGPLWDTDTFDVSAQVASGDTSDRANITITSDCLMWVAQAFSVTTTAPTANSDGDGVRLVSTPQREYHR